MVGVKTFRKQLSNSWRRAEILRGKKSNRICDNNESQAETADIDAPIVFVGYGIKAPEYDGRLQDCRSSWKSGASLCERAQFGRPRFFKGKAMTYYGRWTYKFEETALRGALATLIIHRTDLASYGWDVVRNSWEPSART